MDQESQRELLEVLVSMLRITGQIVVTLGAGKEGVDSGK